MKNKYLLFLLILLFLFSCYNDANRKKNKLLKDAREYYSNDDFEKAYILLDSLLKIDTTIGEAYFMRGGCKVQLSNSSDENSDYFKAIKLNYKKEKAYYNLGVNEWSKFHDSTALLYFKEANKINPTNKKVLDFIKICKQNIRNNNK